MKGLALFIVLTSIINVSAIIINIPDDYATIQQGIDSSSDGDTVLVQPGTYRENVNFMGHNIVLGSFYLTTGDTIYISTTIIRGDSTQSVVTFEIGEDQTAVITGFTICNGKGTGGPDYTAGGITCYYSFPMISHNLIIENTANRYSTGIRCVSASPTIIKNVISNNRGGGIRCTYSTSLIYKI